MKRYLVTYDVEFGGQQTFEFYGENEDEIKERYPDEGEFVEKSLDRSYWAISEIEEVDK